MLRKRKRKISGETTATPRATRQRRVVDDEEERGSTVPEMTSGSPGSPRAPKTPKTPAMGRTTRKKSVVAASQDLTMSTRSRKAMKLKNLNDSDVENEIDQSRQRSKRAASKRGVAESVGSDETHATRSRAKIDTMDAAQDPTEHHSDVENTGKSSLPKEIQPTRKKRILTSADNTIAETPRVLKTPVKSSTRSLAAKSVATKTNTVTESTESLETVDENPLVQFKPSKLYMLGAIVETPKKNVRANSSSLIQSSVDTVTPESSPLPVNLTPHRSLKTPKKSPMNSSSPKTHSQSPLRLSKTPRKLTVLVESPATSDKSGTSMATESPKEVENQRNSVVVLADIIEDDGSTIQNESPPLFVSVATIQLRNSSDKTLSSSANSTTLVSSSSLNVDGDSVNISSPRLKSPKKLGIPGSKIRKSPVKTPALRKDVALGIPQKNRVFTPSKTPANARPSNLVNPDSPKRLRSTLKKSSPVTSTGTPLRPISVSKENPWDESIVVVPKKMSLYLEASSSTTTTPRGKIRRSLHLTPDFTKFAGVQTSSPISTPQTTVLVLPEVFRRSEEPKDKSFELMDGNDFVDMSDNASGNSMAQETKNGTYEVSKDDMDPKKIDQEVLVKTEVQDGTYELAEPKTPNLRRMSRKRSLSNVGTSHCTPEAKKRCRVRFATPSQEDRVKTSSATLESARKSLPTSNTPGKQRLGAGLSVVSSRPGSSRRRSRSLTKIEDKNPSTRAGAKRRSNSVSAFSGGTPKLSQNIQNSVNRLSRPRQTVNSEAKSETKVSVPRKIPNFAQIHQKRFEKMESLVDAKKRVAKRHEELNTASPTPVSPRSSSAPTATVKKKPLPAPSGCQSSEYTRFGFKLRKVEAVKKITNKAGVSTRTKNHVASNRSILKGIRTNRRFELQMKFRKAADDKEDE